MCPKKRLRLEVTNSRVERLGVVVTRQVRMHDLLLLWMVGRQRVRKGSKRKRLQREIGSSWRHRNRGSNSRREFLEMDGALIDVGEQQKWEGPVADKG